MTDNSAALIKARRRDGQTKRARADRTLQEMIESGEPVTFAALARRAGVSVSMLYANQVLAARVSEVRDRQRQAGPTRAWRLPARSLVTEQSLRTELANAKEQVRQLHVEVAVLRERIARSLGAEADLARGRAAASLLDQIEDRAAELESENATLRRRVVEVEAEASEMAESLAAARTANRDLMSMVNR
jgi:chromosome segregation ATPase